MRGLNILGNGRSDATGTAARPEKPLVQRIWEAPATYNRASRRAAGLLSRIWRWDLAAIGATPGPASRYVRRHGARVLAQAEKPGKAPRRVRREAARIERIMAAQGYTGGPDLNARIVRP